MDDEAIAERFEPLGPVSIRRMFGGRGIYHRGLIVALVVRGELLLKADAETAGSFEAAGARRWRYARPGRSEVAMPYWTVPDAAADDPEEFGRWARLAFAASRRAKGTASAADGAFGVEEEP